MPEKSYFLIRHESLMAALRLVKDLRQRVLTEGNDGAWEFLWRVSSHISKAQQQNIRDLMEGK